MLETLSNLDLKTYTQFIYLWGILALFSALSLHFSKLMPMSSRVDAKGLDFLGTINKRAGWIIMETPILVTVLYFYLSTVESFNASAVLVAAFVFHYINRALIYPYRIKVQGKTMPIASMLMSMIFYIVNGYLIGYYFGALKSYSWEWLFDPRFLIGLVLFVSGFIVNLKSDNILIKLRKPGETAYKIPQGGFFKYVSCPNYFGEIIEWIGFALMCWSLPAFVYALWVILPLLAQGIQAHRWYQGTFKSEYPSERKAIFPYLL